MTIQDLRVAKVRTPAAANFAERTMLQKTSDLVAYWRLNPESHGGNDKVVDLVSTSADLSGTPANVIWDRDNISPAGLRCPEFDGSTSTLDLYSAGLNSAMSKTECTISIWAMVDNSGVWTDSTKRVVLHLGADANNYFEICRTTNNDELQAEYKAGGTSKTVTVSTLVANESPVHWMHPCLVVSVTGDTLDFYVNNTSGTQATGLGTWAGNLNSDLTLLGSSALASPANVWSGLIAELGIWGTAITASEVESIYEQGFRND